MPERRRGTSEHNEERNRPKARKATHDGRIIGLLLARAPAATAALLALLLLASPLAPLAQGPAPIGVISAAGRRAIATTVMGDQEYVALDDVAAFLPLTVREDRQGVVITVRGKSIVASRDRALASVDGKVVSLPAPLVRNGNRWLAPVDFIPRALAPLSEQRVEYRRGSRLLVIGTVRVPRVTARIEAAGAGARVPVDIAPPAAATTATDGDRLTIRLDSDAIDFAPLSGSSPLVEQVRADQPSTVTITPAAGAEAKATISNADTLTRVVIDVAAAAAAPDTTSASAASPSPSTLAAPSTPPPALASPKAGVQTVILDPGHGGDDSGVHGASGTLEKQITLEVARRVKAALESKLGVRVLLTRDDDRTLGLDERTAEANNNKGDLFVSLHMNGAPVPSVSGASVLFMRLDREGEETRREAGAQAQALPVLGGGTRIIETIRWDLAQARHVDGSERLANLLVAALDGQHVTLSPQPVQGAPLRVLAGLDMPGVLFEMGYLTNAGQAKQAASDESRAPIVQAVFEAVSRFAAAPPPAPGR